MANKIKNEKKIENIIPNVTVFLAIVVLDSDENEENEESILPKKMRKVSNIVHI